MIASLQEELDFIVNAMTDGIYIADERGVFIAINNVAAQLEGISPKMFIGKHASTLIHHGLLNEDEVITLKVLKTKDVVHQYKESHNGRKIMVTGTPIFKDGALFRILIQERDITAITDLQQELDSLTRIKESIENELAILTKRACLSSKLIYKSHQMDKIVQTCMCIANVDTTVLITGESGTGKGVLASFIHECSSRAAHNFIKIDCTAIPDSLFESELFGYESGSFTGAKKGGKSGLIELANHGTLFIDEIGELPLRLQTKLLTVIQDKAFYRIGGKVPIPLDIRIITATNRDLEEMVAARQLENTIERLVVTTETDTIKPEDLPITITQQATCDAMPDLESHQTYAKAFAAFEQRLLSSVMRNSSSTKEMSQILQIAPNTITTKLKKYGIKIPFKKGPKRHDH